MEYKKLFESVKIGPMEVKNRAVLAPAHVSLCETNGYPGERMVKYYEERAKGGIGLIFTEASSVEREHSSTGQNSFYISEDAAISSLETLTEAIHKYDAKVIVQLYHGGATVGPKFIGGKQPWAPSDVPAAPGGVIPHALTIDEIHDIQQKFVEAAVRCVKAGYDGVELHGAHGYLFAEFWNPHYNKRTDEYGGSFENRMRFIDEIIAMLKKALAPNVVIGARMCGDEMSDWLDDMLDLEDGIRIAKHLEEQGIHYISISNGSAVNPNANCEPYSYQPGWKKHVAKAFKEAMNIPVIATNTIKSPDFAEELLEEGVCDLVALARSQYADPEFMKKAKEGRPEDIRQCIGCMYCRERVIWKSMPVECTVNPRIGREYEYDAVPPQTGNGRPVAVIGGGCGGMEAAKILADRGFKVTLYEKDDKLGGRMNLADKPRFKEIITHLTETMEHEIKQRGVEIKLGVEATPEMVKADIDPVGVFVCTGADWIIPPVPGADKANVCTPEDVLLRKVKADKKAVVVGSGNTGVECVEMLQDDGIEVTMVDMLDEVCKGVYPIITNDLMSRVNVHEPTILLGHALKEITDDGVIVEDMATGEKKTIEADLVCLSVGSRPNAPMIDSFKAAFDKVIVIGSAVKDGRIHDAIKQAYIKGYCFE